MEHVVGPWAHSKNGAGERHDLAAHLAAVAAMARDFADPFGGGALAYWAGLWHDLGVRNAHRTMHRQRNESAR